MTAHLTCTLEVTGSTSAVYLYTTEISHCFPQSFC